jgi:Rieske Fe-S protein
MNRREFVRRLEVVTVGTATGCAGLSLTGCLRFHFVNASVAAGRLVILKEDFGGGRFALVDIPAANALPLFVYRQDDGSYSAVSTRCMHRGCPVEPVGPKLVCPCHGSEYTPTGEVLRGPTERPLRQLPARDEGDRIVIDLPAGGEPW